MVITLYATFRLLAETKTIHVDLPDGTTVQQLVDEVVERFPVLRSHWVDQQGEVYPHVHIFINGSEAQTLPDQLGTHLNSSDRIDFFPPVAGGI